MGGGWVEWGGIGVCVCVCVRGSNWQKHLFIYFELLVEVMKKEVRGG